MNILREKQKLLPMGNFMGGLMGGGGGGGPSTSTSYQTNIPEYARPYVDTMLGATQKQLFQTKDVTNPDTGQTSTEITGFQPYRAFGGTYDKEGNQLSYDPSKAVAGFTGMQTGAQEATRNLQVPGQYGVASDVTGQGIMAAGDVGMQARGLQGMGMQAAGAGDQYARMATNPYAMSAYMSPYMQNVVDVQQQEAIRQSNIQRAANQGQATQAGAFGGSRQGLVEAERQRNLATQLGAIQAQGSQNAFQNAQQAQQFGANLGLQGLQTGAGIYGQGIGAQQAAINQQLAGASQLAGLGGQQLAAQQGIIGLQNQMGAQQQAYNQQVINQAIQDYANAQQYPLMQLGTMSNMLRGLPMQAQTTNQYVAAPNPVTQGIGAMGTYGALKGAGVFGASGGLPSEFKVKSMAAGGITSYGVGGEIESQLASMDEEDLKRQAESSSSPTVRRMAQRLLREKQMEKSQGVGPVGPMGVDYQAAPVQAARGGILAFSRGGSEDDGVEVADAVDARDPRVVSDAEPLPREGILMAAADTSKARSTPTSSAAPAPAPKTAGIASYLDPYKTDLDAAKKEAAQSDQYFLGRAKEGMPGNEAIREYQATQMQERANLEDENKRQRYLRVAQLFAKMGTMPGNVLTAALKATDAQLPEFIADEQQYKKARREIDKSIFDVENSIRLEEAGHAKEARRLKEKALERVKELSHYLIDAEGKVKVSEAEIKSRAEATAAQREANQTYREAGIFNKAMEQMRAAEGDVARVKGQIEREKALPNSQYASDVATVTRYGSVPNLGEDGQKRLDEAKARIAKQDAAYEARILAAEKTAEAFSNRVKSLSGETPAAETTTMSAADVAATAKASGKTEAEVREAAKAKGIKIVK